MDLNLNQEVDLKKLSADTLAREDSEVEVAFLFAH